MTKEQIHAKMAVIKAVLQEDAGHEDKSKLIAVGAALDLLADALVCLNVIAGRQAPME